MFTSTVRTIKAAATEAKTFTKNTRQRVAIEKALAEEEAAWEAFEQEQDRLDAAGL